MFKKKEPEEPPINAEYQKMITTDKDGKPFTKKKKKERQEKPPSTFTRMMRGESLCVTLRKGSGLFYDATETWMPLNEASIRALGYRLAKNYRSGFGRTYIKFIGFEQYPIMVKEDPEDMSDDPKLIRLQTGETAFTLYDYLRSDAQERAVKSMRARKVSAGGSMKFLVYMAIIGIAVVGGFLYMTGRA